jgi:nicotinate-nucleotide pyrophosphorylase (carboxylating)
MPFMAPLESAVIDQAVRSALTEDLPSGDITSEALFVPEARATAVFLAKEEGVIAGLRVARRVFELVDAEVVFEAVSADGREFKPGDILARVEGRSISLLKAERTALNFLQRLSGVASLTRRFVREVEGTKARILDTRKTTPGLRALEKYAVTMGGGANHRFSLSDMVLIKDNHIRQVGSVREALRRARAAAPFGVKVEVEVTDLAGAEQAVAGGADMIMLDNMEPAEMKRVVTFVAGRVPLEASGKVSLERVAEIARSGVDYISVGALTHSYRAIDISLEFQA